jgi:hypothetical protein
LVGFFNFNFAGGFLLLECFQLQIQLVAFDPQPLRWRCSWPAPASRRNGEKQKFCRKCAILGQTHAKKRKK